MVKAIFKEQPVNAQLAGQWPYTAETIRGSYNLWCETVVRAGTAGHVDLFKARATDDGVVIETPFGVDLFSKLTFTARDEVVQGRVLIYRPGDGKTGEKPRAIFSLSIDEDGVIRSGDEGGKPWPRAVASYAYSSVQAFAYQVLAAVLAHDATDSE